MKRILWVFGIVLFIVIVGGATWMVTKVINSALPELKDVESVRVSMLGDPVHWETSFSLFEKDNIEDVYNVHKQLNEYKDTLICSVKEDVVIDYELTDGTVKHFRIEGIRCPEDYFETVMNSYECKRQVLDIFNLEEELITSIEVGDHYIDRDVRRKVTNREEIEYIIELAQQAALLDYSGRESFGVAYFDFYMGDDVVTTTIACREDVALYNYLKEHSILSDVLVSTDEIDYIMVSDDKSGRKITLRDDEAFEVVLDYYFDGHSSMNSVVDVEIVMKNKESRHWYGSFFKGLVPEQIEQWIGIEDWYMKD